MNASKVLRDVVEAATGAKAHYDVWWAQASEGRMRYADSLGTHRDFFDASYDAHYMAYFIYFGRLFDRRRDVSSIGTYLRLIRPTTSVAEFDRLRSEHLALSAKAEPLLTVRHSRVAHVTAALSEKDVFGPLNLTWNKIRDRIYEATNFVGCLAGAEHPGEVGIPRDGRLIEATLRLLRELRRVREGAR